MEGNRTAAVWSLCHLSSSMHILDSQGSSLVSINRLMSFLCISKWVCSPFKIGHLWSNMDFWLPYLSTAYICGFMQEILFHGLFWEPIKSHYTSWKLLHFFFHISVDCHNDYLQIESCWECHFRGLRESKILRHFLSFWERIVSIISKEI